jgi:hypothetical protein
MLDDPLPPGRYTIYAQLPVVERAHAVRTVSTQVTVTP